MYIYFFLFYAMILLSYSLFFSYLILSVLLSPVLRSFSSSPLLAFSLVHLRFYSVFIVISSLFHLLIHPLSPPLLHFLSFLFPSHVLLSLSSLFILLSSFLSLPPLCLPSYYFLLFHSTSLISFTYPPMSPSLSSSPYPLFSFSSPSSPLFPFPSPLPSSPFLSSSPFFSSLFLSPFPLSLGFVRYS